MRIERDGPVILPLVTPARLSVGFMVVIIVLEVGSCCRNGPVCCETPCPRGHVRLEQHDKSKE
jgi:hypothetical protein